MKSLLFEDGRQALDYARGEVVDLVITDLEHACYERYGIDSQFYVNIPIINRFQFLVLTTENR